LRSFLKGMGYFFSHDGTHRATQEREIENNQNGLVTSDSAKSSGYGLPDSRFSSSILKSDAIGFVVRKSKRIDRDKFAVQFTKCAFVGKQSDSRARRHGQVMITIRADIEACVQRSARMNCAATGTLRRGRDGDFTSKHDSLLPDNHRILKLKS